MCEFPARLLLDQMRGVARDADMAQDPEKVITACRFIEGVCRLRLAHEDIDGCQCWYAAVNNADFELELQQAQDR